MRNETMRKKHQQPCEILQLLPRH